MCLFNSCQRQLGGKCVKTFFFFLLLMWKSIALWWNHGYCSWGWSFKLHYSFPFECCVFTILVTVFIFLFLTLGSYRFFYLKKLLEIHLYFPTQRAFWWQIPAWSWSRDLAHHLIQCGTLQCVMSLLLPHLWSSRAVDEKPDSKHARHFRDGRLWGGAHCTSSVIMRPCGTNRCLWGDETGQRRRWRGTAERGEESKERVKGLEVSLRRNKCREESLHVPVCKWRKNKHRAKWEKMRRWRSRSSDGRPGDI